MNDSDSDEDRLARGRRDFGKKDKSKKDKKDKGYVMFEEEDSEEESLVYQEDTRSPAKVKKHKPSFKFAKRDKLYKPKEKDKEKEKEERQKEKLKFEKEEKKEKERREKEEKERREKEEKEQKKREKEKIKLKKKKYLSGSKSSLGSASSVSTTSVVDEKVAIFGVPLAVAVDRSCGHDGIQLPIVFRECIDFIEEHGLTCEGIYRISGVKSKVQMLKDAYNKSAPVFLAEHEPSIVASLLKLYLRELPEPVLTTELMPKFEQASTLKNVKLLVEEYRRLIDLLPICNRLLLSWTIVHMTHVIEKEAVNKMSLQNVSIVLSPTMQISHRVLNVLFTYSPILFRDTIIKKYAPPLRPVSSRWSLELPESPSAIEEELKKQESLLDALHSTLLKVKDVEKEERLWEVQRVVTQLKRKLKHAQKAQEAAAQHSQHRRDDEHLPGHLPGHHHQQHMRQLQQKQQLRLELEPRRDYSPKLPHKLIQERIAEQAEKEKAEAEKLQKEQEQQKAEEKEADEESNIDVKVEFEVDHEGTEEERDVPTPTLDTEVQAPTSDDSDTEPIEEGPMQEVTEGVSGLKVNDEAANEEEDQRDEDADASTPVGGIDEDIMAEEQEQKQEVKETVEEETNQEVEGKNKLSENDATQKADAVEVNEKIAEDNEEMSSTEKRKEMNTKEDLQEAPVVEDETAMEIVISEKDSHQVEAIGTQTQDIPVENESSIEDAESEARISESQRESDSSSSKAEEENVTEPASRNNASGEAPEDLDLTPALASAPAAPRGMQHEAILMPVKLYDPAEMGDPLDYYHQAVLYEDDEEYRQLLRQHTALLLEEEELLAIGRELRQKIATEREVSEQLDQDITEINAIRKDLYSSDEEDDDLDSSDDEDSEERLDEEALQEILTHLKAENLQLVGKNAELVEKIHQEQQVCLAVKVEIRMIQQRQVEVSAGTIESLL